MTTYLDLPRSDHDTPSDLTQELRSALGDAFLPARGDQILAALVRQHTPASLMWQLAGLATHQTFDSFADVVTACAADHTSDRCPRWYA